MFSSFVEGSTKTSGELLGRLYKKIPSIPLQSLKRLVIGDQGKNLWAFHKFKKEATRSSRHISFVLCQVSKSVMSTKKNC